ncbi:Mercuric reductase MerA [mine drainage metagenome]|uniref:Mercuric reductase MerA n=1 Tax=mine drainage metagenome TaxID=410659 RepID=T1ALH1_9ZZZZ
MPKHPRMEGVYETNVNHNFSMIMNGLRSYVQEARESKYKDVIGNYKNVTIYEGLGNFVDWKTIEISDLKGKKIGKVSGSNILIATGSHPSIPSIEGLADTGFITSDTLWDIGELPPSVAIIGGGAIGLEIGQALMHFGSNVTVIEALDSLLPQTEPEIGSAIKSLLEKEGMKFHLRARVNTVHKSEDKKTIEIITHKGKEKLDVDEIIVATGRLPNTGTLNLEAAGVKTDSRGQILTKTSMKTTSPGIYGAGDCVSKRLFLETLAAREGVIAVSNMFGEDLTIDYDSSAWAVFTYPQVAGVGMTENEFSRKSGSCSCRTFPLSNLTKASIMGEKEGLIKITVDPKDNRVVGMQIMAPNATDIITEGVYAVKNGYTIDDIIATSHIFPSMSEGIKIAAQSFIRDINKMSCCVE